MAKSKLAVERGTSKDTILDAAESVFGRAGYAAGSMREISEEAGVAQALLHYHFKTKDQLYREVFARRSEVIVEHRRAKLRAMLDSGPSLEAVLDVLSTPLTEIFAVGKRDYGSYLRMVAEVSAASDERSVGIMQTFYDPVAMDFVEAFMAALPRLTAERAAWAYLFAIGARMQAHVQRDRASRLAKATLEEREHAFLAPFLAAGIRAMAQYDEKRASTQMSEKPKTQRRIG